MHAGESYLRLGLLDTPPARLVVLPHTQSRIVDSRLCNCARSLVSSSARGNIS